MSSIVVVDTNIFISALTSRNDDILRIVSRPGTSFVSTNYIVVELFEHSPRKKVASTKQSFWKS
jgi:predicted nucleic acid-binding protein